MKNHNNASKVLFTLSCLIFGLSVFSASWLSLGMAAIWLVLAAQFVK